MVAIAILGLSLTVILSAQTGLYSGSAHAQNLTVAVAQGRCKMGEIEEKLLKRGFPEIDDTDEGPCCEGEDAPPAGMRCAWRVEKIELPEPAKLEAFAGDAGVAAVQAAGSAAAGGTTGGPGPLGALMQLASGGGQSLREAGDGGIRALASTLQASTAGGTEAIAPLVMGLVYPQLRPMLEASIRKITVKVVWHEGTRERELEIVQYVTHPARGGFLGNLPGAGSASPPGMPSPMSPGGGISPTTVPGR